MSIIKVLLSGVQKSKKSKKIIGPILFYEPSKLEGQIMKFRSTYFDVGLKISEGENLKITDRQHRQTTAAAVVVACNMY